MRISTNANRILVRTTWRTRIWSVVTFAIVQKISSTTIARSRALSLALRLIDFAGQQLHCPFGFDGINCENPINYCSVLDPCRNSAFCTGVSFEPVSFYSIPNSKWMMNFIFGAFTVTFANVTKDLLATIAKSTNECAQRPCLNGGRCIDGVNNLTCDCSSTSYEEYLCEVDVEECRRDDPCVRGRCLNSPGNYSCLCESEDDCGRLIIHSSKKTGPMTSTNPFPVNSIKPKLSFLLKRKKVMWSCHHVPPTKSLTTIKS